MKIIDQSSLIKKRHEDWLNQMWPQQGEWYTSVNDAYRNIICNRQEGITMTMAIESVMVGSTTGRKQVFIASSLEQAKIFRFYIVEWYGTEALKAVDIEFHSVNADLSSKLKGAGEMDIYIDNYLWMTEKNLSDLHDVMQQHKPHRTTWLSARQPSWKHKLLEQVTHSTKWRLDAH